ncbi:MAG: DUF1904 family protein [Marinifilaceae bacterium]
MPTLRFHAIDQDRLLKVSANLLDDLVHIVQVPEDYFNFEVIRSACIIRNQIGDGFPIVEILAFQRDIEVEDQMAKAVTKHLQRAGYPDSEVYFIHLEKRHYYNNGEHY